MPNAIYSLGSLATTHTTLTFLPLIRSDLVLRWRANFVHSTNANRECDDADKVKKGDYLSMHYTGTIDESSPAGEKGEKFDSSRDRGQTFDFTCGVGQVIKGEDDANICL